MGGAPEAEKAVQPKGPDACPRSRKGKENGRFLCHLPSKPATSCALLGHLPSQRPTKQTCDKVRALGLPPKPSRRPTKHACCVKVCAGYFSRGVSCKRWLRPVYRPAMCRLVMPIAKPAPLSSRDIVWLWLVCMMSCTVRVKFIYTQCTKHKLSPSIYSPSRVVVSLTGG